MTKMVSFKIICSIADKRGLSCDFVFAN